MLAHNRNLHYCKHCKADFLAPVDPEEEGDVFLVCPKCGWKHYRHFKAGLAIHCEISKAEGPIREIGYRSPVLNNERS